MGRAPCLLIQVPVVPVLDIMVTEVRAMVERVGHGLVVRGRRIIGICDMRGFCEAVGHPRVVRHERGGAQGFWGSEVPIGGRGRWMMTGDIYNHQSLVSVQ